MASPSLVSLVRWHRICRAVNSCRYRWPGPFADQSRLAVRRFLLLPCLIALALPACSGKPSAVTPSIVGVVESSYDELAASPVIRLDDGTTFDTSGAKALRGGRPFHGELLLAGGSGDDRWFYAATSSADQPWASPDCPFTVSAGDVWEEPDAMVFGVGLRLPKAAAYVPYEPRKEPYRDAIFCVNGDGEVTGHP